MNLYYLKNVIDWDNAIFIAWCIIVFAGLVKMMLARMGISPQLGIGNVKAKKSIFEYRIVGIFITFLKDLLSALKERQHLFQNENKMEPELVDEHVKSMLRKRIIEGFVLTEAAIPSPWNTIKPVEGFRVFEDQRYGEEHLNNVVACVSAENIFLMLHDVIFMIGEQISVAITEHNSSNNEVHSYVAHNKDAIILWSIFLAHRWMIQNNGDISISLWSDDGDIECHLESTKLFVFFTKESETVTQFLRKFGLQENKDMKFFPEGGVITLNKWRNTHELQIMLNELNSEEMQAF